MLRITKKDGPEWVTVDEELARPRYRKAKLAAEKRRPATKTTTGGMKAADSKTSQPRASKLIKAAR